MKGSFMGTSALRAALQSHEASGIGVAQVVREHQRLTRLEQATPPFDISSLEGFLAAKMTE